MPSLPSTRLRRKRAIQRDLARFIEALRSEAKTAIHLGCGPDRIPGMINCDAFDDAADMKLGATDLSPFGDGTVDLIETHHMVEHLTSTEAERALKEWARVLRPGGWLVVTCPDLEGVAKKFLRADPERRWQSIAPMIYGSQEHAGMFHHSGYDATRLRQLLEEAGFDVRLTYTPYPARPTPSLLAIAQRR